MKLPLVLILVLAGLTARVLSTSPDQIAYDWDAWWKTNDLVTIMLVVSLIGTSLSCVVWWLLEALLEWSRHR